MYPLEFYLDCITVMSLVVADIHDCQRRLSREIWVILDQKGWIENLTELEDRLSYLDDESITYFEIEPLHTVSMSLSQTIGSYYQGLSGDYQISTEERILLAEMYRLADYLTDLTFCMNT